MIPVKYGPTSPATVAAIASSSSARPSATRPASIIASPCVWTASATSSGSPTSRPIRIRVGDPRERAVQVAGEQRDGGLEHGEEARARGPAGARPTCRCARIRKPPPTAGSPRMKCSIASRAAAAPAAASFPSAS